MNKTLKIFLIVITVVICVPILSLILFGIFVNIGNNIVADNIESDLLDIALPENTEIIDSTSVAGKISGNGNGMQYVGAILVKSELTSEELEEYYESHSERIGVYNIHTEIEFEYHYDAYNFPTDVPENTYCIECWNYEMPQWFKQINEFDLRGH